MPGSRTPTDDLLIGQIVLRDRVLLYRADPTDNVIWSQIRIQQSDVMAAAASLERVTSSPATSQMSVDQAARRARRAFSSARPPRLRPEDSLLLLEPDPLLGNIPWSAVETRQGADRPALCTGRSAIRTAECSRRRSAGMSLEDSFDRPLVIGASDGAGGSALLPEVLKEARTVASLETDPNLLLARAGHGAAGG